MRVLISFVTMGVAALCFATFATTAFAADSSGAAALRQARAAWDRGAVSESEGYYRDALAAGGLAPPEVIEGYVRLGAARASAGKKAQAVAAFRAAAILDPKFAIPPEAGPTGSALAARARKDTAKIGAIQLTLSAPKQAPVGKPFTVLVQLDSAHVPIVAKLAVVARDGTSGKETRLEAPVGTNTEIEVPSNLTMPGANLTLRADALDAHDNRLASTDEHVQIGDGATAVATKTSTAPAAAKTETPSRSSGFWSTPWPYVIGGVALASVSTAVYFGTRPPDQVSVGAVDVRPR